MTLILTAICDDDICICADTRYEDTKWPGGNKDGFDKIYKFDSYPLIIFNYAVNKFNDNYWNKYCKDFEESGIWKGKNLDELSDKFKVFIEPVVKQQLDFNIRHWPGDNNVSKSGFTICGKNNQNNSFEVYEYFWAPNPKLPEMFPWTGIRMNGFGTGYDNYLKEDINSNPDMFVNWSAFDKRQIKGELERLFLVAKNRKNRMGGKELSDDFIIKSVMD